MTSPWNDDASVSFAYKNLVQSSTVSRTGNAALSQQRPDKNQIQWHKALLDFPDQRLRP